MRILFCSSFLVGSLIYSSVFYGLDIKQNLPNVELSGKEGGKVDGTPWKSSDLVGKMSIIVYTDPSHKDDNKPVSNAIKAKNFPRDKFASHAIVNMAASWIPDALIESKIKESQKEFPFTTYVKDVNRTIVKTFQVPDKQNVFILADAKGVVLFVKAGPLNDEEVKTVVSLMEKNLLTEEQRAEVAPAVPTKSKN